MPNLCRRVNPRTIHAGLPLLDSRGRRKESKMKNLEKLIEIHGGKVVALARHLERDPDDIVETEHKTYTVGKQEYYVMTDYERDEALRDRVYNYVDDELLNQIPENLQSYFNRERLYEDVQSEGASNWLACYDGIEHETLNPETGEMLFVYRIN